MYSPGHVANFMLERGEKESRAITQMKLQKLVYIGYGWALVFNETLFEDPILAWKHGPVIRSLYDEFKHYGNEPITERSIEWDLDDCEFTEPEIPDSDEKSRIILGKVWDVYKHFTASALRNKTHEEGSPWSTTWEKDGKNSPIPPELIREHFKMKIKQYIENAA